MEGEQRGFAQCKIPLCREKGQVDRVAGWEIWKDEWAEKDMVLPCINETREEQIRMTLSHHKTLPLKIQGKEQKCGGNSTLRKGSYC